MPYFDTWTYSGTVYGKQNIGGFKEIGMTRNVFIARLMDVSGDWNLACEQMKPEIPDSLYNSGIGQEYLTSKEDIDLVITECLDQGIGGLYVKVYSHAFSGYPSYFNEWIYDGAELKGKTYHHRYYTRVDGLQGDWNELLQVMVKDAPQSVVDSQSVEVNSLEDLDSSLTVFENKGILGAYMIVYSTGWYISGQYLGNFTEDGKQTDDSTGQQYKRYISRVHDTTYGEPWDVAGFYALDLVPDIIEGEVITSKWFEDKASLGLWIVALGQPNLGWSFAGFGLKAFTADHYESQINGITGSWEDFIADGGCEIMKEQLPDLVDGRVPKKDTARCYQTAFGVFMEVEVEEETSTTDIVLYTVIGIGVAFALSLGALSYQRVQSTKQKEKQE